MLTSISNLHLRPILNILNIHFLRGDKGGIEDIGDKWGCPIPNNIDPLARMNPRVTNIEDIEDDSPSYKNEKRPSGIPQHVQQFLIDAQYGDDLPDWEPESCQRFLKQLENEFVMFQVHGWHGCRMPPEWPEDMKLAIQGIYVRSLQPPDGWSCPAGCKSHKTYWTSPSGLKVCSTCHPSPKA